MSPPVDDVELEERHREIRRRAREFAEREIRPVAREYNREGTYPREIIRKAAAEGFVADTIPEAYGGADRDVLASAITTEEMWRADPAIGFAIDLAAFTTNVYILDEYGDEWMKREWFPEIADGEAISAIAVTEPDHGSDVGGIETTARREGDEWVLDGHKKYVGNATVADVYLVLAKTDPGAGRRGVSVFLVPGGAEGMTSARIEEKMGMGASDWGEIRLDGVRVPGGNLIGEENGAFYYFMESLAPGRTTVAAHGLGAAQGALEAAKEYATDREQFDQPVADFQAIRHKLADMETQVEAARSLTYRAARHAERDSEQAARFASMAKLFASEMAVDVTGEAVQTFGAAGYLAENDVERFYRDARAITIYEGTSEIQKNVIADGILPDAPEGAGTEAGDGTGEVASD